MWFSLMAWLACIGLAQAMLYLPLRLAVTGEARWMHALDGQKGRCRIFLVGSSPVLTGLSADELDRATGCAVVNTALSNLGSLVTEYLELVLQQVQPDDIIVLSDRDWLSQEGVESRCRFDHFAPSWLAKPQLVPNINGLFSITFGMPKTGKGDLAHFPQAPGTQARLSMRDLSITHACRQKILQYQLRLIRQRLALPVVAPPPIFARPEDRAELEAVLIVLNINLRKLTEPAIWVAPWIDSDSIYFSLDGQHTSALGRRRWTDAVAFEIISHRQAPSR